MFMFFVLCLAEVFIELGISLILGKLYYPELLEDGFIFRNWFLVIIYKLPVYFFCSIFLLAFYSLNKKYIPLFYLICSIVSHFILIYGVFKSSFFVYDFLCHPTYGILERFLLVSILLAIGTYVCITFSPFRLASKK